MKQRILSLFLAVAMVTTMLVAAAPSASAAYVYEPESSLIAELRTFFLDVFSTFTGLPESMVAEALDSNSFYFSSYGNVKDKAVLDQLNLEYFNHLVKLYGADVFDIPDEYKDDFGSIVLEDSRYGIYRIYDVLAGKFVVDDNGDFPYVEVAGDVPTEQVSASQISANKWLDTRSLGKVTDVVIVTRDVLAETVMKLAEYGVSAKVTELTIRNVKYHVITKDQNQYIYATASNMPFVAPIENTSAAENEYNYIVDGDGNTITNQFIDNENGVITNIQDDSTTEQFDIDYITYNFDDHSYTANTYNFDNDTYNYYTWNYTYYITNTYYTYIGSSAEYQNTAYEFYYELPDGRSSADLTAEEVAGLSFQFTDVVNYAKSATDTSLRSLYHFDGDTADSSYFSTQTSFEWQSGASITYMDSGVFDGCLYLDNTAHQFTMTLPSNIGSGDFTMQFRYYQASEADTASNIENYFSIGGLTCLKWDEASLYNSSGTKICALPIGTWNEIAVVRHDGILYFYLNGLCVTSSASTSALANEIIFTFGSTSRAYSQLDELRFVNFALAESGAAYTCTSVPYDTNSVLVLPGGMLPIADEYYSFDTDPNLFSFGDSFATATASYCFQTSTSNSNNQMSYKGLNSSNPYWYSFCTYYGDSIVWNENFTTINAVSVPSEATLSSNSLSSLYYVSMRGLNIPLAIYNGSSWPKPISTGFPITSAGTYTFCVYDRDLTPYSITFTLPESLTANNSTAGGITCADGTFYSAFNVFGKYYKEFDWGYLVLDCGRIQSGFTCITAAILPNDGTSFDFVYTELVPGDSPAGGHEFVTGLYDPTVLLPNTAAVQSDIPVNGYTVGGVRPTFPERGDVWFPVEGSRITGCYIYTGSMWESVGCRYYTGKRWIPIYALDIVTMADMWDTADGDTVEEIITSEYNFWNWWQRQWLDFRSWLSENWTGSPGSSGGSGTITEEVLPSEPPTSEEEDNGFTFVDVLVALKDGTWRVVRGVVSVGSDGIVGLVSSIGDVGNFFDAYSGDGGIFDQSNFGGEDIWD